MTEILNWIAGRADEAGQGRRLDNLNPETDQVMSRVCRSDADDVRRAVDAAQSTWQSFRHSTPSQRESILLSAAEILARDADDFRQLLIDEVGSPISKANMEIGIATRVLKANAAMARRMTGRTYGSDVSRSSDEAGQSIHRPRWSMGFRRPLGVVAGITPFNVPLIKGVKHSSIALATANPFVWLPSPEAPGVADRLGRVYDEAGLPAGAFNVVQGLGAELGDVLVKDPRVRLVSFTGSTTVGKHIQSLCGQSGKRVTLECGGKNPLIVLADADLNAAVSAAVRGGFIYQGQICMASSRVIVEEPVAEAFKKRLLAAVASLSMGKLSDPSTVIGPIINERSRARIREIMEDAESKGAKILCGNRWSANRMEPTLVTDVNASMEWSRNEAFAPIVSLEIAADLDAAVKSAQPGDWMERAPGILSAAVFTQNLQSAMSVAERLDTGMIHVNDMTIQQEPEVPFGGDGESGFGREGMETGIDDYTSWKWVTVR